MFKIVDSEGGYHLLKSDKGYTVVYKSTKGNGPPDARSVMPGDMPKGGGEWTARWSRKGVKYVASWYSYSWAREIFNRKTKENIERIEAHLKDYAEREGIDLRSDQSWNV